jgi:hypothetical protein
MTIFVALGIGLSSGEIKQVGPLIEQGTHITELMVPPGEHADRILVFYGELGRRFSERNHGWFRTGDAGVFAWVETEIVAGPGYVVCALPFTWPLDGGKKT